MEQVQASSSASPWFNQVCSRIVFGILRQVSFGALTLHHGEQTEVFGDPNHPLQAALTIHSQDVFQTLLFKGDIGVAEAFIEGKWSSPELTKVIEFFVANQSALDAIERKLGPLLRLGYFAKKFKRRNSVTQAKQNILAHYDLGNHLYSEFLDPHMQYSSGIYPDVNASLEQAQDCKLATICQRLDLQPEDHVMEIGTGWGGLAIYMAQHYGCQVTTTTISDAQHDYAWNKIVELGLEKQITLLRQDYRELEGQYDKLVSIEMIEAVGHEYLDNFFAKCNALLKPNGLMLLQAITIADQRYEHYRKGVDFIQTYIFPGGCLPSVQRLSNKIAEQTDMVIHELHDIGLHYAKTLAHWRQRFLAAWPRLSEQGFDHQFKLLWLYYLCYCEGGFKQRAISTVHLSARKPLYQG